jgi:RNA polymerase sigma-70 factor, ECF subfamily
MTDGRNDAKTASAVLCVKDHVDRQQGGTDRSINLVHQTDDQLVSEIANEIPESADGPEAILEKQNESAVLRQCLTQLSAAHREVIDLVYYHEKSIAEVAEIIGAPQNTVKTRMFHARKRIKTLLDAHGFDAAA